MLWELAEGASVKHASSSLQEKVWKREREASQACAQPLRAVVAQRSKQGGWDSDVSMAFPDNSAVLLCIPMA